MKPSKSLLSTIKIVVLSCATLHLVILAVEALATGDYQIINLFNIVALSLLVPALGSTVWGFWLSWVAVAVFFAVVAAARRRRAATPAAHA